MIYLIAVSAAGAVALVVLLVAQLIPAQSGAVARRVQEVALDPGQSAVARRRRKEQRDRLEQLLEVLGQRLRGFSADNEASQELLTHAGYRSPKAPAIYWGTRVAAAVVLAGMTAIALPIVGMGSGVVLLAGVYMGAVGYMIPLLVVRSRVRKRQKEITLTLPDALDLLVVCVEAGLGLNQAFVRVAEEIHSLSEAMSEEIHLLNLEIRAGQPRDAALRNLYTRTGVEDVRGLTLMLIQADRFGTSIANALRVHSDTLRDKRRQRAEEAAAKTAIKLIFPLVLFIFPAMFVVLVGPGMIQITEAFSAIGK